MERITLTVSETAAALGLSKRTVTDLIRRGEIHSTRLGGRRLVDAARLRNQVSSPQAGSR